MYKIIILCLITIAGLLNFSCSDGSTSPNDTDQQSETTGTVTDIDGNIYKTIKIGDLWWMAENLKVTQYRTGEPIANISDTSWTNLVTSAYCNYNNDTNNGEVYGRLYNWFAVVDNKNIAPEGWHIATDEEWKQLEVELGMSEDEVDNIEWRGLIAPKLREAGKEHWGEGLDSNNESGFTALPGGIRLEDNSDLFLSWLAFFWSPSAQQNKPLNRQLSYITNGVKRFIGEAPQSGMSVRCVKNY
jgi:uncharacterized protein (TIGR02145 family)